MDILNGFFKVNFDSSFRGRQGLLRGVRGVLRSHLFIFPDSIQFLIQSVLFLLGCFLLVSSHFPLLDVCFSSCDLELFYLWTNFSKLVENWKHNILNESGLASCDVGCGSVAHHRNLKTLCLFHVSLVEELFEEEICPLDRQLKVSERSGDITRV